MAYVRKVRTASGAVAVQVARKDQGKVVILAHLGSAHTDAELGILLHAARQMVLDGQAALDFEVSARAQSMADVADFRDGGLICPPGRSAAPAPVARRAHIGDQQPVALRGARTPVWLAGFRRGRR